VPAELAPMLASPGELPRSGTDQWAYELKWDGIRALASVADGTVRLSSRSGRDITAAYPELLPVGQVTRGLSAVLDGEIVALDETGRPSFGRLQRRMNLQDPAQVAALVGEVPVRYVVFDLLELNGTDLTRVPYRQRRELLEELEIDSAVATVPPNFVGQVEAAERFSRTHGLEGVVAKRLDSLYLPGRRTTAWVKTKFTHDQAVVLGGWRHGEGARERLGAVLMGVPAADGTLLFVGRVGSGLTEHGIDVLLRRFGELASEVNPFGETLPAIERRGALFLKPELVGEVRHTEWTADNRLRAPVWRGLRTDLTVADVTREPA
jgi:bifunctional non-homologous end joining protein LigD